jgi:hypothetical protein
MKGVEDTRHRASNKITGASALSFDFKQSERVRQDPP